MIDERCMQLILECLSVVTFFNCVLSLIGFSRASRPVPRLRQLYDAQSIECLDASREVFAPLLSTEWTTLPLWANGPGHTTVEIFTTNLLAPGTS